MKGTQCLLDVGVALKRAQTSLLSSNIVRSRVSPIVSRPLHRHILTQLPPKCLQFAQQRHLYTPSTPNSKQFQRQLRDEFIPRERVILVDNEGKLGPERSRDEVLASMNRKEYFLLCVDTEQMENVAICRMMNKKAAADAQRAKKKNKTVNAGAVIKTIELNWAIDSNDLSHRLGKIQTFLEKGNKVVIALAPKRGGRKATQDEAHALLAKIRACIEEVDGARETLPMEGEVLKHAKLVAGRL